MGMLRASLVVFVPIFIATLIVPHLFNGVKIKSPNTGSMNHGRVVVIGGGLAGLSAAVEAQRNGAEVIIVDKEARSHLFLFLLNRSVLPVLKLALLAVLVGIRRKQAQG